MLPVEVGNHIPDWSSHDTTGAKLCEEQVQPRGLVKEEMVLPVVVRVPVGH